ncbi:hypothetical protein COOONC_18484 [Cooperia oncophora]
MTYDGKSTTTRTDIRNMISFWAFALLPRPSLVENPTSKGNSEAVVHSIHQLFTSRIFGMCNNFTFSVMLSAAQDILNRHERSPYEHNVTDFCIPEITSRICSPTSAGVVLLCNIVPALLVKLLCPFVMHRIPYG